MTVVLGPSAQSAPIQGVLGPISCDARDFGAYARTGDWIFTLKVARSVRPGGQSADETPKVSAKEFTEPAGCSPERMMRYDKAWDVETVQADPELRVQERRTKFYSSLRKATKVFEEPTFDDADDIYEDDMVQRLKELRQAIGSRITALRSAAPRQ